MNYGQEFIKLHNTELFTFKNEFINKIEKDYDSPLEDEDLYDVYKNYIQGKLNEIKENDSKDGYSTSIMGICCTYLEQKKYKVDRVENIFKRDIKIYFSNHHKYSKYENFNHFLTLFSKYTVLRQYSNLLYDNRSLFCEELSKKDIKSFFIIKKTEDGLDSLVNFKLLKDEKAQSKKEIKLSDNQRMIILHVFKKYYKNDKEDDNETEYFRVFSLCSEALEKNEDRVAKTNNTKYKYFLYGVNNSDKDKIGKTKMVDEILTILAPLNGYNRLKKALNFYKKSIK
ncbi:hypothetical protein [Polaribacter sp. R77954]|uniref:hypothetical protein n=1 Tax=Polaribacter sp. R77954 TaxID=3093870 RepID=UPI0037C99230